MNPEKGYCYPIWWGWTYGRPSILAYDNAGEIYLTKRCGEKLDIEKLNPQQYEKVMEVCKIPQETQTNGQKTFIRRYNNVIIFLKLVSSKKQYVGRFQENLVVQYQV